MICIVDHHDSFTYNLVQTVAGLGGRPHVVQAGDAAPEDVARRNLRGLIVASGSGRPEDAGGSVAIIRACAGRMPVLGVGLGHRCIGAAFGGAVVAARAPRHGRGDTVDHDGRGLFAGLEMPFVAARYDSAVLCPDTLPETLVVTARFAGGEIAGVRHRELPVEGIQFDPASVLTVKGRRVVENFLRMAGGTRAL